MKTRLFIFAALLLGWTAAHAQNPNPGIVLVTSAPSGSCTVNLPDEQVITLGTLYSCQSGTWAQITGGGGGGFPNPPAFSVQGSNIGSNAFISDSNIQINTALHQEVDKLPIVNVLHTDFGPLASCAASADPTGGAN